MTWQDPHLSSKGEQQCLHAGKVLFGQDRDQDNYHLFSGDLSYKAVYVSPMRRTLKTALLIFGRAAAAAGIPFKAMPWAHEKRGSISDVGIGSSELLEFATKLVTSDGRMGSVGNLVTEPLLTLNTMLRSLPEDWSTNPSVPDAELPYYPENSGFTTEKEPHGFLVKRMAKLQSEMLEIDEDAAILVAHSGVIRMLLQPFLFGQRPDNAAIIYGELSQDGWSNVKLLGDGAHRNEQIDGLAGFRPEAVACRDRDCNNYDEEFRTLGIARKYARGTCCSSSTVRLWVYDTLLPALTYFKPPKDPRHDKSRATVRLETTTSVWYTSYAHVVLRPDQFENALPRDGRTSFSMTLQPKSRHEHAVWFHRATCDTCASLFVHGADDQMQTLIIFTSKEGANDYSCKKAEDACFLLLKAEEYEHDTKVAAQRRLAKIAVAAACRNSDDSDIDTSLAKCSDHSTYD